MENNVKKDSYSLKEFMANLKEKVLSFGIDPKCAENPAFETVLLSDVKSFVDTCGVDDYTKAMVEETEENGEKVISFTNIGAGDIERGFSMVKRYSNDTESCLSLSTWEKREYAEQKDFSNKRYEFRKSTQNDDYFLETDAASNVCSGNERDGYSAYLSRKVDNYDSAGIGYKTVDCYMHPRNPDRRYNLLDPRIQIRNVDTFDPRFTVYFDGRKLEVSRRYLDVADVKYEKYEQGSLKEKVSGSTTIASEHGLSKLNLIGLVSDCADDVITPLSEDGINEMISREKNPKIAEGLRKYTAGRSTYSYDPSTAPNFEYYSSDSANRSR